VKSQLHFQSMSMFFNNNCKNYLISPSQLDQLEYRKIHVKGSYLFRKQFIIRWRGRLDVSQYEPKKYFNLLDAPSTTNNNGAQVITPFNISGTE
jgi:hypothetical protein